MWTLLLLLSSPPPAAEVDVVELARVLIAAGHLDRAEAALAELDRGPPRAEAFRLRGLVRLDRGDAAPAAADLARALSLGDPDPATHRWLAEAALAAGQPLDAAKALLRAPPAARSGAAAARLESRIYRALGEPRLAFDALERHGPPAGPDRVSLGRERTLVLLALGLSEAAKASVGWLADPAARPEDALAILSEAAEVPRELLVAAELRFPASAELAVATAARLAEAAPLAAAERLLPFVGRADALALDAAELFRRAGRPARALAVNLAVRDPRARLRQRVAILVDRGAHAEVLALGPRLLRLGLLADGELAYALAYAEVHVGRLDAAERRLRAIADPALGDRATALLLAIERCRAGGTTCG